MSSRKLSYPIVAFMAVMSVLMIVPLLILISTALKSLGEISTRAGLLRFFIPKQVIFGNFREVFLQANWPRYFLNSALVTILTALISASINSVAGYSFARLHFKGRDILLIFSMIGLMIPPQATIIPVFFILKNFPLAGGNDIFGHGGTGFINTYFGLMAPYLAGSFGVLLFRQYFLNFPQSLDDAAKIDGLNRFKTFIRIYTPLSKPVFVSLILLKATQTWNDYTWPLIITNSVNMRTVQIALVIFKNDSEIKWNYLMAATLVIMIPLVVLFLFVQRSFVEGITTTGMKG
ncbi:MAG: carbohydrate ABC transporter permease [Treponema sp.]|nr:carbohydrate ABC transporter permease [Treponema sp.]